MLRFKLFLFGDEDAAEELRKEELRNADKKTDTETVEEQEEKTYTQEEVDEMKKNLLTKEEVEEIVKKRLAREKAKAEEDKKEAERLSKLSEKERQAEESKKKDEVIAKLQAEIDRNNLEKDTIDRLNEEGLPLEFKIFLMREDAEKTNETIKSFKGIYQKKVQEEVEKRFKGKTPSGSQGRVKGDVWQGIADRYK